MTPEAIEARRRRNVEWEKKRFNSTLKEFLEYKYGTIFEEYCSFYESLVAKHPNKRNFLNTSTFKTWRRHIIEETFEKEDNVHAKVFDLIETNDSDHDSEREDNVHAEVSDLTEPNSEHDSEREDNVQAEVSDLAEPSSEHDSEREDNVHAEVSDLTEPSEREDILSAAIEPVEVILTDPIDISQLEDADNVINEIIRELEQDAEMRELLNDGNDMVHDEDEGIALDYQTELEAIVESFDYQLEVDF